MDLDPETEARAKRYARLMDHRSRALTSGPQMFRPAALKNISDQEKRRFAAAAWRAGIPLHELARHVGVKPWDVRKMLGEMRATDPTLPLRTRGFRPPWYWRSRLDELIAEAEK